MCVSISRNSNYRTPFTTAMYPIYVFNISCNGAHIYDRIRISFFTSDGKHVTEITHKQSIHKTSRLKLIKNFNQINSKFRTYDD